MESTRYPVGASGKPLINKGDVIGYVKTPDNKIFEERFTLLLDIPVTGILGINFLKKMQFKLVNGRVGFGNYMMNEVTSVPEEVFTINNLINQTHRNKLSAKFLCKPTRIDGIRARFCDDNKDFNSAQDPVKALKSVPRAILKNELRKNRVNQMSAI